jgi:hypothetical protein
MAKTLVVAVGQDDDVLVLGRVDAVEAEVSVDVADVLAEPALGWTR